MICNLDVFFKYLHITFDGTSYRTWIWQGWWGVYSLSMLVSIFAWHVIVEFNTDELVAALVDFSFLPTFIVTNLTVFVLLILFVISPVLFSSFSLSTYVFLFLSL